MAVSLVSSRLWCKTTLMPNRVQSLLTSCLSRTGWVPRCNAQATGISGQHDHTWWLCVPLQANRLLCEGFYWEIRVQRPLVRKNCVKILQVWYDQKWQSSKGYYPSRFFIFCTETGFSTNVRKWNRLYFQRCCFRKSHRVNSSRLSRGEKQDERLKADERRPNAPNERLSRQRVLLRQLLRLFYAKEVSD